MSENRRFNRFAGDAENPFDEERTDSLREADRAIFGGDDVTLDTQRVVAKGIKTSEIAPDVRQPRRQIPSLVRQRWDDGDMDILFGIWIEMFAAEMHTSLERAAALIRMIVNGEDVHPNEVYEGSIPLSERRVGPMEKSLIAVAHLAADIRQAGGLTNPITVVQTQNGYLLETGERRWLAYNMLYLTYGDDRWSKIPARTVDAFNVWRQAGENAAREQLTAIGTARMLALLLMNLHGEDRFRSFEEMVTDGGCDRAFYAQVEDGRQWPIPRNKGEMLCIKIGVKNPVQLRQYRNLLSVPDEVWTAADDLGWAEKTIRELVRLSVNPRHLVELAALEAEKDGYTVTGVTTLAPDLTDQQATISSEDDLSTEGRVFDDSSLDGDHPDDWPDEYEDPADSEPVPPAAPAEPVDQPAAAPAAPARTGMDAVYERALKMAYRYATRAAGGRGWVTAAQAGTYPRVMNEMAALGWLENRRPGNTDNRITAYRITPSGCQFVGLKALVFEPEPQPMGKSAGQERPRNLFSDHERGVLLQLEALKEVDFAPDAPERDKYLRLLHDAARFIGEAIERAENA